MEAKDKKLNATQTLDQVIRKTLIQKLLIVNDDAEDILAIQSRLPKSIDAYAASQWQLRNMKCSSNYLFDLIILNNDAADRDESEDSKTLQKIKEKYPDVPVVYTIFEPGCVADDVKNTRGVTVVKKNLVLKYLAEEYNLAIKKKKRGVVSKKTPKVNLIITYRGVGSYKTGIYNNGELVIVSYDESAMDQAKEVVRGYMKRLCNEFDFRRDRDIIKNVFVYDGLSEGRLPGMLALVLAQDLQMPIYLMTCGCDWDRKQDLAYDPSIKLYKVSCGGQRELGIVADMVLRIKRPGENHASHDSEMWRDINFGTQKF